MAYTPALNDVLSVRIITFDPTSPTQVGINNVFFQVTGTTGGGATQSEIASRVDGLNAANMKAMLPTVCLYRGIMVQKVFPLPRQLAEFAIGSAGAGTSGGDQMPTQVAGLIKLFTDKAGRAFRGRIYTPFVPSNFVGVTGNSTAGMLTALNNLATSLITTIVTTGGFGGTVTMKPVIFHRRGYGKPPVNINGVDFITSALGSPLLATQRRRGNYGRINASSPI